jgi:deoxyribodipyrimidine photo-lyase
MITAIWWIRRDLRLIDNQALIAALEHSQTVIPLFIIDPKLVNSPFSSQERTAFLFDGLRALDISLQQIGSKLLIRSGDPHAVLLGLFDETGAEQIFAEADISPYAQSRDTKVTSNLALKLTSGLTVYPPEMVTKPDGSPYTVFTPFSRMWRSLPFLPKPFPAPKRLNPPPALQSQRIPDSPRSASQDIFPAGEAEAQRRLAAFTEGMITHYAEDRNRMDLDGTSRLSPYLRFGMLSARQAIWAAQQAKASTRDTQSARSTETWINELIWREFYATILYHFPYVRRMAFRAELRQIPWRDDPAEFSAWAEGRTGYPVVDAAMRQLNTTGWMHNRARMITASFLTKDLLINWQHGERYFMQHLLDGDPAANNGGWQWTAGTGTDAAPYFRIFNPILQGKKFDPQGTYVRRWVPELASVPAAYIHTPWEMPEEVQQSTNCVIGKDYSAPIVDHAQARERVLAAYRQGR